MVSEVEIEPTPPIMLISPKHCQVAINIGNV